MLDSDMFTDDVDNTAISHVGMLVREYGMANDKDLSDSAKKLKKSVLAKVMQWYTMCQLKGVL